MKSQAALSTLDEKTLADVSGGRQYREAGDGSTSTLTVDGCTVSEVIDAGAAGSFKLLWRLCAH